MILVISRDGLELTTELVCDWIAALGGEVLRLNAEDLWPGRRASLRLRPDGVGDRVVLHTPVVDAAPVEVPAEDVKVVWYRRWTNLRGYLEELDPLADAAWAGLPAHGVRGALGAELAAAGAGLLGTFAHARWLSEPGTASVDKIGALRQARGVGLDVPDTLLTTSRADVVDFLAHHPDGVITKTLAAAPLSVDLDEHETLATYTTEVDPEAVARWPETFAPSLFQERIAKRDELRVFVLGDQLWAMAILSQSDERTAVDFRRYPGDRPTRYVPFRLDDELSGRLLELMRSLRLDTGSIDLVRGVDGRVVFLEVNPVGQFGMVSTPCNYHLERRVAEHLLALHDHLG